MLLKGTREDLIALVEKIMRPEGSTEAEQDARLEQFRNSVTHPAVTNLIFYPERFFGEGHRPTAEEIVDKAIAHRAIQL